MFSTDGQLSCDNARYSGSVCSGSVCSGSVCSGSVCSSINCPNSRDVLPIMSTSGSLFLRLVIYTDYYLIRHTSWNCGWM